MEDQEASLFHDFDSTDQLRSNFYPSSCEQAMKTSD